MTLRRRTLLGAALALPVAARAVAAAPWPARPLRLIVVYPPGGVSDTIARTLARGLEQRLGQPVVVDNRPGNGGAVGMQALARARPDGYTLAFSAATPLTLKPHLQKVPYALRDFAPVAAVMSTPVLLVGTPLFTGSQFADVVAQARAQPGALRWATSGIATSGHLVLEQVCLGAGVSVTHVPYKGGGQQIQDALGGEFELLSTNLAAEQLRLVREGRFKPLALGAPARLPVLPDVPTFAELGLPEANVSSLFGVFAAAGTPASRIARLNALINELLGQAQLQERLLATDNIPGGDSPGAFAQRLRHEWESNRRLAAKMAAAGPNIGS